MVSNYLSRLHAGTHKGAWKLFSGKESGVQNQVDVLVEQGKVLFGNSRRTHCFPSGNSAVPDILLRPCAIGAPQANLHIANGKNLSVGAFVRAISIPSEPWYLSQVSRCHVRNLLSEPNQGLNTKSQRALVGACISRLPPTRCSISNLNSSPAQPGISRYHSFSSLVRESCYNCRTAGLSLRNKGQPNNFVIDGCFMYNALKRKGNVNQFLRSGLMSLHILSPASYSTGAAHVVSFDNSVRDCLHTNSANSSQPNLKLNSGSCYMPHPDKAETGGEDAHFICIDEHAIGVADGVGGWADLGVDAGKYSRELMENSVLAVKEEPRGSVDPSRVLEKAYQSTKAKGSSTACIIALTDQGIRAINLGDSGFMVVRDGSMVFRSPVQQHDFNFTYQLETGNAGDLPASGQVFTIRVAAGDVLVAGTDGLFDNLYINDITAVVVQAVRAGFQPQVTAQKITALARQRAQDKNRQTPFSTAAQEAGFRYYGGKLDDITVIVSYISSCDKNQSSSGTNRSN